MAKDDKNYSAYLTANLEKFKGKWIILCNEHVIASGEDIKKIVSEVQTKCPDENFLLARVSEEGAMVLVLPPNISPCLVRGFPVKSS